MTTVWQILAGNLAAVALIVSIWMHVSYRLYRLTPRHHNLVFGLALGIAVVASMMLSVQFEPGVYFDLRFALIETAAVFGGPMSLILTAGIAILFRGVLGGSGAAPGISGILIASVFGYLVWLLIRRKPAGKATTIIFAATSSAITSLAVLPLLPPDIAHRAIREVALPSAAINFIATAAAGVFITYFRRFTLERDVLYAALTQAPDYHYVKDLDHRFVVTNLNVARHHGRERASQMTGLTDIDLEGADRGGQLEAIERRILETGVPLRDFEECLPDGPDKLRWFSTSKVPLRNRHGELVGLAGVTCDITDKKQLEIDLKSSRDLLKRAMTDMSDGFAMFNANGCLVFCNEQYRTSFPKSAYARTEGAHISDILRAVVITEERKDLPLGLSDEQIEQAASTLHTNKDEIVPLFDGRWLSLRTRAADDGTALVLVTDITALKENEQSLQEFAEHMKRLAQTDGLTGLSNRRAFNETLLAEWNQAEASRKLLALILLDIDRFKLLNDTYGHVAGDACLKVVAGLIGSLVNRSGGFAARFGGEEFAILLPGYHAEAAIEFADELRAAIRAREIVNSGSEFGVVTVSAGVACLSPSLTTCAPEDLIDLADGVLYQAKNSGRDRVMLATLTHQALPQVKAAL